MEYLYWILENYLTAILFFHLNEICEKKITQRTRVFIVIIRVVFVNSKFLTVKLRLCVKFKKKPLVLYKGLLIV